MKIYLASSFSLVPKVEEVCQALESEGHKITCKWWDYSQDNLYTLSPTITEKKKDNAHPEIFYADPVVKMIYDRDYKGILDAEALVLVAGDEPKPFNGASIEMGLALGWGIKCYSVGCLENSAMYYPVTKCKSVDELLVVFGK